MNGADFAVHKEHILNEASKKLASKNKVYADDSEFFFNFDIGSTLLEVSRTKYAFALMTKHIVRLFTKSDEMGKDDLVEVITDIVAYLILVYAMLQERK